MNNTRGCSERQRGRRLFKAVLVNNPLAALLRSSHHPVVRAVVKLVPHTTDQEGDFLEANMSLQIGRAVTSARKRRTREVTAQGKNALTHP